ncbi:MAG: YgiT-type zinc finger protein [Proteobacteria bacterium]|nr:YgiT-type zinc finger protein [Pseudomonadota bacterium]
MKCSIKGCPGTYEHRLIVHTIKHSDDVVVFGNVPAEVCTVCSDTVLTPETVQHIERQLVGNRPPARLVPLYQYA